MGTAAADTSGLATQRATQRGGGSSGPRFLSVCAGLLVCVSGALFAGASERAEQTSQPRQSASGETKRGITLVPSTHAKRTHQTDVNSGRVSVTAGTLDFLIRIAYDVYLRDIVYEIELDHLATYDVVAISPDQRVDTTHAMMRGKLEATFDFEAARERRRVNVLILQRVNGLRPPPESTSKQADIRRRKGRFAGTRVSMADLVNFARRITRAPVVDETGLDGVYDLVMEWDPSGRENAWFQAFRDLGLELVDGKRSVEQLVISRAESQPEATPDE